MEKSVNTFDNLGTKVLRPHPANYSIHNKIKSGIFLNVSLSGTLFSCSSPSLCLPTSRWPVLLGRTNRRIHSSHQSNNKVHDNGEWMSRPSNLKSIRQWNVATTTPVSCVNVSSSRQLSWRVCTSLKASQCWWWESASSPTWCTSACCRRSRTYCWAPRTSSSPVVSMTDAGLRFFLLSTARIDAFLVFMLK